MKIVTAYLAFDGKSFDSSDACKAYESEQVEAHVAGRTVEQIRAALDGTDADLRDALEEIGRRCSVARREAGDFRRRPKAQRTADERTAAEPDGPSGAPGVDLEAAGAAPGDARSAA